MEPDELNSSSPADPALDAWLRQNATLPPLADDGFTARVVAALPAPASQAELTQADARRAAEARRRVWFCVVGALAGLAVRYVDFSAPGSAPGGAWNFAQTVQLELGRLGAETNGRALVLAAAITAGSLLLVYWRRLDPLRRLLS